MVKDFVQMSLFDLMETKSSELNVDSILENHHLRNNISLLVKRWL